jgi:TRAP transporter TAXI family solute receptor
LTDLKNRRVYLGAQGTGTRVISELVIKHYGLTLSELASEGETKWNFAEAAKALMAGRIDAAFFMGGVGMEAVKALARDGRFTLLEVDRAEGITKVLPYLAKSRIPHGTYSSPMAFPDRDITTIEAEEIFICHSDLDDRTAYLMVEAIFRNSPQLIAALPNLSSFLKSDQLHGRMFYPVRFLPESNGVPCGIPSKATGRLSSLSWASCLSSSRSSHMCVVITPDVVSKPSWLQRSKPLSV